MNKEKLFRVIIRARFFLSRAYGFGQVPMQVLVAAGVLVPYIQNYYPIRFFYVVAIALIGLLFIGAVDYYSGFVKAETSFGQEQNKKLNDDIQELNIKLDRLLNGNS